MSRKIQTREKSFAMKKLEPKETSVLIILLNSLIRNTGLLSYTTILKVHWASNITTVFYIITCILQAIALVMARDDPDRLFECCSVLAFCSMGLYKLKSLRYNHSRWRFLLNQISTLEYEELNHLFTSDAEYQLEDEDRHNFSNYINNYTDNFKSTSAILKKIYGLTAIIFILSPFIEYLLKKAQGLESLQYPHILPGWTPLDELNIFCYLIMVFCEFLASVYCVCVHIAFDLTAVGVMIFICGQFSLLRDYCTSIGGNGRLCNLSRRRDDRASFRIKNCHHINMILINSIIELDRLLKNIIGVYFVLATLTLCSVAVRLKSSDDNMNITRLIMLLQYMCGTLTQLYLFCRYGNAVLNESSICMGQGPFASAYWCVSPHIRRDLVLLSVGMMSPRHMHAGPFNYLDLSSFIQVLRAAYSYYAFLGQKK